MGAPRTFAPGQSTAPISLPLTPMPNEQALSVDVRETSPGSGREKGEGARRVAVLVCHGMGEQVPFETIDDIAREVVDVCKAEGTEGELDVGQEVGGDGSFIPRAEIRFTSKEGARVVADFYEAYWAPLTEGKIGLFGTISFLCTAALRGLRFALHGIFDRWMFGGRQEFRVRPRAIMQLLLAWWSVVVITIMLAGWSALVLALVASILGVSWPRPSDLAAIVSFDLAALAHLLVIGAVAFVVTRTFGTRHRPIPSIHSPDRGVLAPARSSRAIFLLLAIIVVVAAVWLAVIFDRWLQHIILGSDGVFIGCVVGSLIIGVALAWLAWVLVEYLGDVAIYVSSYKASRFQDTRSAIQAASRAIARQIYAAQGADRFDDVLVVGHSLGSVIAYDALDDAIDRDLHVGGWFPESARDQYTVVARTRLLLTFGSPLDKTAFIFRTQESREAFEIREALAATMQPLIVREDYGYRPTHWINIWSRHDWVSGALDYYDAPDATTPKRVLNVQANTAFDPIRAHTGYWTQPLVRGVIYGALTGRLPADVNSHAVVDDGDLETLCEAFPGSPCCPTPAPADGDQPAARQVEQV